MGFFGAFLGTDFSGRDLAGLSHPGIVRDGTGRGTLRTVRYRTGLSHHGIEQDSLGWIEILRDCTELDFTGCKKHGTPRDGIKIPRDITGSKKHGTPRAPVLRSTMVQRRPLDSSTRHR